MLIFITYFISDVDEHFHTKENYVMIFNIFTNNCVVDFTTKSLLLSNFVYLSKLTKSRTKVYRLTEVETLRYQYVQIKQVQVHMNINKVIIEEPCNWL